MADFILLYKGPAFDMNNMSEEEMMASMEEWKKWMEKVGDGMVEFGAPMISGTSIVDNGNSAQASDLNGYSIIRAKDMDQAKEMVNGHPHLSEGKGKYSIEIFELKPVQM